jgi:hypothetical protein
MVESSGQSTASGARPQLPDGHGVNCCTHPPRRWFRLHPSSYFALLLGATFIFFLNVPGQYTPYVRFDGQGKYSIEFYVNDRIEHGWPWAYLRRDILPSNWNWNSMIAPEPVSLWSLSQEVTEFRSLPLLSDIAVGIFVLVAVVISFEYWRRQRRRLFQLRLCDLLIGTAIVAVAIAYGLNAAREYDREQAALAELGVSPGDYFRSSGGPSWLRELIPVSFPAVFDRVVRIDVENPSKLEHVSRLSELRVVRLSGADPSGKEIGVFAELPRLEALELSFVHPRSAPDEDYNDTNSDAEFARGLQSLAGLKHLAALDVSNSSFGDKSAAAIADFKKLRILDAGETLVTNQGLANLAEIESLEELTIQGENITDEGLQYLVRLKRLRWLSLAAWDVTDQGLVHLADLKDLRGLDLRYTSVKGPGLKHLQGLLGLESFIPPIEADPDAISSFKHIIPSRRVIE